MAPKKAEKEAATAAKKAAVRPRESAYDECQEGGFFHAGLQPRTDVPAVGLLVATVEAAPEGGRLSSACAVACASFFAASAASAAS